MNKIEKILVPIDFSEMTSEAVAYASELARMHNASLDIVHVFEEPAFPSFYGAGALMLYGKVPDIKKEAGAALTKIADSIAESSAGNGADITINTHLLEGHAADQICVFAREKGTDLIVIPTHGLTGLRHIFLGSVAERVVREAHCPVFVLKTPREEVMRPKLSSTEKVYSHEKNKQDAVPD